MTSFKQIEANRVNALKSTGLRTEHGKRRSRSNAVRHGLTAETVISAFENAGDYASFEISIASDYQIATVTEQILVARLTSVLWRLRRSTSIETGMFQLQGELMANGKGTASSRKKDLQPGWYDEFDVGSPSIDTYSTGDRCPETGLNDQTNSAKELACCFLRISRLQFGTFELLTRYETGLWRQAAQLILMLQTKLNR